MSNSHVVRLKGGDPFIFGRAQEEIEYAEAFGIETAIVPGISSINLPGYYGIPLTIRGVNESFWVITATKSDGNLSRDVKLAARTNATVVLFMGLKKLQEILQVYKSAQKEDLPIAIISQGSLPQGGLLIGTVDTIEQKVERAKPVAPALIVLGETVGAHPEFYSQVESLKDELLGAT